MPIDCRLTVSEFRLGAYGGVDRHARAMAKDRPDTVPWRSNVIDSHIYGVWGEIVVAKLLGVYWQETEGPDRGAPDVSNLHVRCATYTDGNLTVKPRCDDHGAFVLVVPLALPTFRVQGWMWGEEAKVAKYYKNTTPPAYYPPVPDLHPLWSAMDLEDVDALAHERMLERTA